MQSRYFASVPENAVPGTYVLTVAVADADIVPHVTFHLLGDGAEHFYLHQDKGDNSFLEKLSNILELYLEIKRNVLSKIKYAFEFSFGFSVSGELKTSKLLDREAMPKYTLKAYVYDRDFVEWDCVSYIEVTLTDVNDNAPDFRQSSHKVSLSEDSAVGTFITKMNAVDFDRGNFNMLHRVF